MSLIELELWDAVNTPLPGRKNVDHIAGDLRNGPMGDQLEERLMQPEVQLGRGPIKIHRKGGGAVQSFDRCDHNVPTWDICAICDPEGFRFWYGWDYG